MNQPNAEQALEVMYNALGQIAVNRATHDELTKMYMIVKQALGAKTELKAA